MTRRVTLYSRPGCHLCDDARAVIERVCADLGEAYEEISIADDPELSHRFGVSGLVEKAGRAKDAS